MFSPCMVSTLLIMLLIVYVKCDSHIPLTYPLSAELYIAIFVITLEP